MRRHLRDANENRITPMGCKPRKNGASIVAGKKMSDGDEDYRAEGGRCERIEEPAAKNAQLGKDPSAQIRADHAEHDIRYTAEAAAARNFSRKPPGNQADQQPIDEPVTIFDNDDVGIERQSKQSYKHHASFGGESFYSKRGAEQPGSEEETSFVAALLLQTQLRASRTRILTACSVAAGSYSESHRAPGRDRGRLCPRLRGQGKGL